VRHPTPEEGPCPSRCSMPPAAVAHRRRCRSSMLVAPPRNKGICYPADPPTVEEIVAVMRHAGDRVHGRRLRGLILVLWRAGLRIHEALALGEATWIRDAGRCLCAGARAVAAARSGWTTGRGSSLSPGSRCVSSCRSGRRSASSTARPADGRGRPPRHAPSSGTSLARPAYDGASRRTSYSTRTPSRWRAGRTASLPCIGPWSSGGPSIARWWQLSAQYSTNASSPSLANGFKAASTTATLSCDLAAEYRITARASFRLFVCTPPPRASGTPRRAGVRCRRAIQQNSSLFRLGGCGPIGESCAGDEAESEVPAAGYCRFWAKGRRRPDRQTGCLAFVLCDRPVRVDRDARRSPEGALRRETLSAFRCRLGVAGAVAWLRGATGPSRDQRLPCKVWRCRGRYRSSWRASSGPAPGGELGVRSAAEARIPSTSSRS
jgi:hypothetical protein